MWADVVTWRLVFNRELELDLHPQEQETGISHGDITKEGVNACQTDVACLRLVLSLVFQIIEKCQNHFGINVFEV